MVVGEEGGHSHLGGPGRAGSKAGPAALRAPVRWRVLEAPIIPNSIKAEGELLSSYSQYLRGVVLSEAADGKAHIALCQAGRGRAGVWSQRPATQNPKASTAGVHQPRLPLGLGLPLPPDHGDSPAVPPQRWRQVSPESRTHNLKEKTFRFLVACSGDPE